MLNLCKRIYFKFLVSNLLLLATTFTSPKPYLFKAFKELRGNISYVEFTQAPTPVIHLKKAGMLMGMDQLYCKQDAQVGKIFGGNKVRKLEFLLGDALDKKSKRIITVGLVGSNHAAATAVYSHRVGLHCALVLAPQPVTSYARRNLLIDHAYGATLYHAQNYTERTNKLRELIDYYTQHDGIAPYVIPAGGATPHGALGFVNAVYELKEQISKGELPEPDTLIVPLGTAGTVAGLLLGLKMCNLKTKVLAICIDAKDTPEILKERIETIFRNANDLLSNHSSRIPTFVLSDDDYSIKMDHAGNYYAHVTQNTAHAITLLESTERIKLDGTYAGKAFAALSSQAQYDTDLKSKVVLFWNTFSSGEPIFPANKTCNDYHKLPSEFHKYFESPLEVLDQGY